MRYFLGLDLSITSKLALARWRETALPKFDKAVPSANFHITLSFLGQVNEATLEKLCDAIDDIEGKSEPIKLTLEQMGYWSKPKILYLAPSNIVPPLHALEEKTTKIARRCNIVMKHSIYKPHVTIARGLKANPPCELFAPNIPCEFNEMHLFESVSGKQGVSYPVRKSWKLANL